MLKNSLIKFIRYFYDPNAAYADKIIEKWLKALVRLFIDIFVNGFITYMFLVSLKILFPLEWIKTGTIFTFPLYIIWCGIVVYFIRQMIQWWRKKQ